ncbi:MAG: hypothetical protein ACPL3C_09880 [Pyrobaculum sp.]
MNSERREKLTEAIVSVLKLHDLAGEALLLRQVSRAREYLSKAVRVLRSAASRYMSSMEIVEELDELLVELRRAEGVVEMDRCRWRLHRIVERVIEHGIFNRELGEGLYVLPVGGYVDGAVRRFAEEFYRIKRLLVEAELADGKASDLVAYVVGNRAYVRIGIDWWHTSAVFFDREAGSYVARYYSPSGWGLLRELTPWASHRTVAEGEERWLDVLFRGVDAERVARALALMSTAAATAALIAEIRQDHALRQEALSAMRQFVDGEASVEELITLARYL